jgi:prolyl oligopeptidase
LSAKDAGQLDIPIDGTIQLLTAVHSETQSELLYTYESFHEPLSIFEYFPECGERRLWYKRSLPAGFTPSHIRKTSVRSKDGTLIPTMLVARRENGLGSGLPVIMTGYGGFGVPMTPRFSVLVSIMISLGATFVLPQIRGGGEFGQAWYEAACSQTRQVAFDDFIAVAEWLCAKGETSEHRLSIFGGSNAGLLVGVAMTQRPDLFRAVLCIAPLLDMVRYEHFDQAIKWRGEYGSVDKAEDFTSLLSYSPYHHVEDKINYPAVLFVSGDKDDRCNPAHVRKMAARLQQRNAQVHPVLVDYSEERGHSPVLPLSVRVEALVRRIAFLCRELSIPIAGMEDFDETIRS